MTRTPPLTIGTGVYGVDVSLVTRTSGVIVGVLVGTGSARYVPIAEATDAQLANPLNWYRYEIVTAAGATAIVDDGAEPMPGDALDWLIASYRALPNRDGHQGAALRKAIKRAATLGLGASGRRGIAIETETAGRLELSATAVSGGAFTRLDVRRGGELLIAQSGTHRNEHSALMDLWGALRIMIDVR